MDALGQAPALLLSGRHERREQPVPLRGIGRLGRGGHGRPGRGRRSEGAILHLRLEPASRELRGVRHVRRT